MIVMINMRVRCEGGRPRESVVPVSRERGRQKTRIFVDLTRLYLLSPPPTDPTPNFLIFYFIFLYFSYLAVINYPPRARERRMNGDAGTLHRLVT